MFGEGVNHPWLPRAATGINLIVIDTLRYLLGGGLSIFERRNCGTTRRALQSDSGVVQVPGVNFPN